MASRAQPALWRETWRAGAVRSGALLTAVVLFVATVAMAVAVASYHASDAALNTAAGGPPANLLGTPGAWFADLALTAFGPVAALLLPVLPIVALRLWREQPAGRWGRMLRQEAIGVALMASALAFVWLLSGNSNNALGIDKNPAGQFMTDGIIVLLARRDFPALARWTLLPLLASGLIFTGSRGAFVGLIVGLAMLASLSTGDRRLILLRVVPLALAAVIAYQHLPDDLRARATTLSSSGPSASGVYTLKIRQRYQHDALAIIRARPWTGVGVGNYLAGSVAQNDLTSDPHDVLLLTTAEGGLPLLAGFGLLLVGSSVPLMRRRTSWAPVALAVQAAIVAHGVADVYWVRSTPTLGWLLIGFALAERHVAKFAAPTQHHVVPRYAGATL